MSKKNHPLRVRPLVAAAMLLGVAALFWLAKPVFSQDAGGTITPDAANPNVQSAIWLPLIQNADLATATPTPTPTRAATPTAQPGQTATPSDTPGGTATATPPGAQLTPLPPPVADEWTQFGHNAQHTAYQPQAVSLPWRWKWVWNGSNATGGIAAGKSGLPRNSQPVTGGGRVYVAAGARGVFALDGATGAVLWNGNPGGSINSTPAYSALTGALFVVSSDGKLYKLNAATGASMGDVPGGTASDLPLPPVVDGERVYFSMGAFVHSVNAATLAINWSYDAGAFVDTPPAYSAQTNIVVAASRDLQVHAIDAATGARRWRVKPTGRTQAATSAIQKNEAEVRRGWPVIAEGHGVVFIRYRLDWSTLWTWTPWPAANTQMRANLTQRHDQQALYALRLDTGAVSFIPNVGNGGFGDGDYMPMGPLPTVKRFDDGSEVAYNDDQLNADLFGVYDAQIPDLRLPQSGTYRAVVEWRQGEGTYTLGISTNQPLELSAEGVTHASGRLQDVFPVQRWMFDGHAGDVLTFTMTGESVTLDPGHTPVNHACLFRPFDPAQHRAGRQAHGLRDVIERGAPIRLQGAQYLLIDLVQCFHEGNFAGLLCKTQITIIYLQE